MAKKSKQVQPATTQQGPSDEPTVTDTSIRLVQESVNARGEKCPAGTAIAPDVDGWPAHRVERHLRNGLAK